MLTLVGCAKYQVSRLPADRCPVEVPAGGAHVLDGDVL